MKKEFLVYVIVSIVFISCRHTYHFCVATKSTSSQIQNTVLTATTDSSTSILKGEVTESRTGEPIGFAYIRVENKDFFIDTLCNIEGEFSLEIPVDSFDIIVSAPGYMDLSLKDYFGSRQLREMHFSLGSGQGFIEYEITSRKELSQEELDNLRTELESR